MYYQSLTCGFYGKWCARDRSLYKETEEQWETAGVMTGKSITENDKHILANGSND